jgi:hypothetical protein
MYFMRKILLAGACLLSLTAAFSQTEIGVQGGVTRNRFWGDDSYGKYHNAITGFSFGGVFRKGISNHLSLTTGLSYQRTGSGINDLVFSDPFGVNLAKGDLVLKLDYLIIPVTANYNFGKSKAFGLGAGFFAGYLASAEYRIHFEPGSGGVPEKQSNRSNYEDFNFGLTGNVSYRLRLSKSKSFVFSIEDHWGLRDISKYPNPTKTNSPGLYASFLIDLK